MKAITHKLKQSLLIWLFVILPLAGLSPALMADDEAAPPEAETTEELHLLIQRKQSLLMRKRVRKPKPVRLMIIKVYLIIRVMGPQPSTSSQPPCYGQ